MAAQFEPDPSNFRDEISKMMYAFGDSANPNAETVILVESVVLKQLRSLVQEAKQVSVDRGKKNITNYELIYLIHKNKNVLKLKRLHDLQVQQEKFEAIKNIKLIQELVGDAEASDKDNLVWRRKKRTHIKIIKELDGTSQVEKVNHDYLGHLRKLRATRVTEAMPMDQYEPYQKARCISFRTKEYTRDLVKLRRWIDPDRAFKMAYSALEVLGFIAYETVGDIVEAVLLSRQRKLVGHDGAMLSTKFSSVVSTSYGLWPITVNEVNEALSKYFTPKIWLNNLFFENLGLDYLTELGM